MLRLAMKDSASLGKRGDPQLPGRRRGDRVEEPRDDAQEKQRLGLRPCGPKQGSLSLRLHVCKQYLLWALKYMDRTYFGLFGASGFFRVVKVSTTTAF